MITRTRWITASSKFTKLVRDWDGTKAFILKERIVAQNITEGKDILCMKEYGVVDEECDGRWEG
jgi:hypothetical protein